MARLDGRRQGRAVVRERRRSGDGSALPVASGARRVGVSCRPDEIDLAGPCVSLERRRGSHLAPRPALRGSPLRPPPLGAVQPGHDLTGSTWRRNRPGTPARAEAGGLGGRPATLLPELARRDSRLTAGHPLVQGLRGWSASAPACYDSTARRLGAATPPIRPSRTGNKSRTTRSRTIVRDAAASRARTRSPACPRRFRAQRDRVAPAPWLSTTGEFDLGVWLPQTAPTTMTPGHCPNPERRGRGVRRQEKLLQGLHLARTRSRS